MNDEPETRIQRYTRAVSEYPELLVLASLVAIIAYGGSYAADVYAATPATGYHLGFVVGVLSTGTVGVAVIWHVVSQNRVSMIDAE